MNDTLKAGSSELREFITLRELAAKLGKHYRTIHRAHRSGKIKTIYCGASVLVPLGEATKILRQGWR